jgi:hypothetical protein
MGDALFSCRGIKTHERDDFVQSKVNQAASDPTAGSNVRASEQHDDIEHCLIQFSYAPTPNMVTRTHKKHNDQRFIPENQCPQHVQVFWRGKKQAHYQLQKEQIKKNKSSQGWI